MPSLLFFPPPPDCDDPETAIESELWLGRRVYIPRPGGIIGIVTEVYRKPANYPKGAMAREKMLLLRQQAMRGANWLARLWWRDRRGNEQTTVVCTSRLRSVDRDYDHAVPWASRL